jgi:hypothetical protein
MNSVLPPSWRHVSTIFVGGLAEVGFTPDERYLLLLSHSGRGLIETSSEVELYHRKAVVTSRHF